MAKKIPKVSLEDKLNTMTTVLRAGGWEVQVQSRESALADSHFWYAYHVGDAWLQMIQIPADTTPRVLQHGRSLSATEMTWVRNALNVIIRGHGASTVGKDPDLLQLAVLLMVYWSSTKTSMTTPDGAKHRFILLYPTDATEARLRPFASGFGGSANYPLSADMTEQFLQQVLAIDRANHPEWFSFE